MKKIVNVLLTAGIAATGAVALAACGGNGSTKIGVIREDATSGEALAWEKYLKAVGKDLNISFNFTTTTDSASEVKAVSTYAAKGYKGIMLFAAQDMVAATTECNKNGMWVVSPTGHPTETDLETIGKLDKWLGSIAPTSDQEYKAGYDMAKYFVEELEQETFTIFGGATCYASDMHVSRLTGMLSYLCEGGLATYDGASSRYDLYGKVIGQGVDVTKFSSAKYTITGYMDGFAFDTAFNTKLQQSMLAGGTTILSVGATDAVTGIAYGIASQVPEIDASKLMTGGVDAITGDYTDLFYIGYKYDCGKYASAMAPALTLLVSALNGNKIVDNEGKAPRAGLEYWVATSGESLQTMLANDNPDTGYCYDATVINAAVEKGLAGFNELCDANYDAVAIHNRTR